MPLTTEEIIKTIESNTTTIMFQNRKDVYEDMIRQLARFRRAFNKYPPVYMDEYDMDLYELLTKHQITFITDESSATKLVKEITASKCTNIFTTAFDGILIYVH